MRVGTRGHSETLFDGGMFANTYTTDFSEGKGEKGGG